MDLCTLEKNNKLIESFCKVIEKNYKTFYLLNPDGILDSVAGLENLSISFCNISFKSIICYKCLTFFECESSANFRKCPKCKVVNAIVPYDNIGKKVIILICFQCNNRNITNIECSYVQCYLCNYMNYAQNYNLDNNNREGINRNRVTGRRRRKKINFFIFRNMCQCVRPQNSTRNNSRENNTNDEQNDNTLMENVNENHTEVTNANNVLEEDREICNNQRMNNIIFNNEEMHGTMRENIVYNEENDGQLNKFNVNNKNEDILNTNGRLTRENIKKFDNNNIKKKKKKHKKVINNNKYLEKNNNSEYNEKKNLEKHNNFNTISNDDRTYKSSCNLSTQAGSCPRNGDMWCDESLNILNDNDEKLESVVESGNVKRKTLMFDNINNAYNKKIIKKLSFTLASDKKYSDVKRYIEYFNKLYRNKDSNMELMLENGNYYKVFNTYGKNLEIKNFYEYLEYYKKLNKKNITDYHSKKNMVDNTIKRNFNNNKNVKNNNYVENFNNLELHNFNNNKKKMNADNHNNLILNNKDNISYLDKHTLKVNNKNRDLNLYSIKENKELNNSQKVKNKNEDTEKKKSACIEIESDKKSKFIKENNDLKSKNKFNKSSHKKKKKYEVKSIFYSKSELCSEFR
ncbi:conserved Plasmodium protein, unknown function [Plasmodium relictum]|uniref:Uncharacterized protein n=1 Tax=Plasmodium relictum TaxID=85471 RepID=A0A1J1HAS6_PLARL|nr:conserved Plasmodium protein, unknown function [Plasmodium relictum]CRH02499.1 conserved Plasmodium protein, unknown function [Plasmodium relictum]